MASGISFKSFLSIHRESKISPNLRNSICSETEKKGRKSVVEVLRLRQSYMPVNFHLCAIPGSKTCSSANEELIFPRLHRKPLIVTSTLWCTAHFRCSFIISCSRCPSSSKFRCVSTTGVKNSCGSLLRRHFRARTSVWRQLHINRKIVLTSAFAEV